MSSMLALHAGSTDFNSSRSHIYQSQQSENSHKATSQGSGFNSWFQSGLPTPPANREMTGVSVGSSYGSYASSFPQSNSQRNPNPIPLDTRSSNFSNNSNNSEVGGIRNNVGNGFGFYESEKNRESQIASHLQIPASVNNSKGSLAEFAAELTCLFWFETAGTIEYAEKLPIDAYPDRGLCPDATPSIGFRKWVTTILSTTQVGKNVILLALMFIYRLKKFNPTVSGKRGSEFRLLTIALMLGNKFLDDNTYTNKTWAEVSGISVNEIHVMEVEFLSNMRYELYASETQWKEWKAKLGRFSSFYEKASRMFSQDQPKSISPVTPTSQTIPHKLPSPPSRTQPYANIPNPLNNLPQLPRSPAKSYGLPEHLFERKRSLDIGMELPPAKRMHYPQTSNAHLSPAILTPTSGYTPDSIGSGGALSMADPFLSHRAAQLPMPRASIVQGNLSNQLAPLSLPPNRAMASIYPSTTAPYSQPVTPISNLPASMPQLGPMGLSNLGDGSRAPSQNGSAHTSPINLYGTTTPTRAGLSPSYFLMNRSSPYRPVRHVNTLLIPPPSGAMQSQSKAIGYDQIHYQPLSKNSVQTHTGPVPFLQPDAWQSNTSTPQLYRPY